MNEFSRPRLIRVVLPCGEQGVNRTRFISVRDKNNPQIHGCGYTLVGRPSYDARPVCIFFFLYSLFFFFFVRPNKKFPHSEATARIILAVKKTRGWLDTFQKWRHMVAGWRMKNRSAFSMVVFLFVLWFRRTSLPCDAHQFPTVCSNFPSGVLAVGLISTAKKAQVM